MASANVSWQRSALTRAQRWSALGCRGATIWFTGPPAAGKSTLAGHVEELLIATGAGAYLLDGDNLRHGLCADLEFDRASRDENVRRVGEVACLFADSGTIALVALVSPYLAERRAVRELHEHAGLDFLEVFVNTPVHECEARDPKGLYRRVRAGELHGVTGIDAPYEAPPAPELEIGPEVGIEAAADTVVRALMLALDRRAGIEKERET
ncbi:MAG: adenylyl-sulfate kinase [Solirubrobacteraceae bacterium]